MKRFLLGSLLMGLISFAAKTQVTVFSDNFTTSEGTSYTTVTGSIGTSLNWSFFRPGGDWGARIDNGILDLTNDATATANTLGWGFGYTQTSFFTAPYSTTLGSNTALVTWTFNMRQIRTDPSGFASGNYGVAFILGGESNLAATFGNGYAVVLGEIGSTDPIRLIRYTGGLQGTLNNIITSNTVGLNDFGLEYLSIKVTYDPATNNWELFLRDDGTVAFADPAVGSLTSQGIVSNNTYTGVPLNFIGGYWTGSTVATQTAFFDNVSVLVGALTNTITVGLLSSVTFNIDCFSDGSGTIDFTSSGTFNAGNNYVAELSDATGSFASPTVIGTLASIANTGQIPIAIPAGTPTGAGYLIRIVSTSPVVTSSNTSATITINLSGVCTSSATDYFRSRATGNWNAATTWQSSITGLAGTWMNATLTPTSAANTIQVRNGHTVSVTASVAMDQVQIESGGILNHTGGTITVDDGATVADIDIQSGGVFRLAVSNGFPTMGAPTSIIKVRTGGILRVAAGGMTGAGAGVNSNNVDYEHQSILDWAPTLASSFSTGSVTYFPNAGPAVIPIFRSNNIISMQVGAAASTVINGVFEANNATVIWENSGTKTFRNGLRGSALIDGQNGTNPSGTFIINGVTAEIGGTGSLVLPTAIPLQIGSASNPTTVTLTASKTITGSITLVSTTHNTYVDLGANDLTVSGTVGISVKNTYIRTNGIGKLKLLNVGSGASGKLFPIGLTSVNPLFISSTSTADYSARIVEPITPPIYDLNQSVQRSWYITCSAIAPNAFISFGYSYPADCGGLYNNTGPVELGVNVTGVWSRHQSSLTPSPFILVSGTFIVTPTLPINYFNNASTEFPFAIANNGAILPIDCIISTRAQKRNNTGIISWTVNSCAEVNSFEVQRSVGNGAYQTSGTINPSINQTDFSFTDPSLAKGTNLYRIKVKGLTGSIKYSNTVALVYDTDDILISSVVPNPVHRVATLTLSAAKPGGADFKVYNMAGSLVKQWHSKFAEGNNTIGMNVTELPAGVYQVLVSTIYSKTVTGFIKQ